MTDGYKVCSKCQATKLLSEFSAHRGSKSAKSGFRSTCKSCDVEYNRTYRAKNRELVNATKRAWAEKNKDKKCQSDKIYREKNRDRLVLKSKKWYEDNKDAANAKAKIYRLENKEKKALADKRWSAANRDKTRAASKRWRERNPEKAKLVRLNNEAKHPFRARLKQQKRRERIKENGLFLVTQQDAQRLLSGGCFYCGGSSAHIDHVVPVARGGSHSIGNLVGACQKCNQSKGSKFITEWNKVKLN
jgi:5-methylcytosine-specific restriction endonuclease McrA